MTPNRSDSPRTWPIAPVALAAAALAVLVRVPTYLAAAHLSFDDGVYGASAVAMRYGGVPFRDVFSSQGPVFLPVVWLGDLLGARTFNSPRLLAVISGAVVAGFAAAIAGRIDPQRSLTTRRIAAGAAGGLAATSGALWWTTGPLTSDGPTIAFATAAIWCAFAFRSRPRTSLAVAIGVLLGCALGIKLILAGPAIAVCALLIASTQRWRALGVAVIGLVVIPVTATVGFGPQRVWDQVVAYHLKSRIGSRNPLVHLRKLGSTLLDRDLLITACFVVAVVAMIAIAFRTRNPKMTTRATFLERTVTGLTPIGIWLGLTVAVLAIQQPLWRNHVAYVIAPMAITVGVAVSRGGLPTLALITVAILALPYHVAHTRPMWNPEPYRGDNAAIARALRELPADAQVISDDPGLAWRAGRRTPDNFVDTSVLRITSPIPGVAITTGTVMNAAERPEVCAVVVTSPDRFGALLGLGHSLAGQGYSLDVDLGAGRGVWVKSGCASRVPARR